MLGLSRLLSLSLALAPLVAGCTGLSLGENAPGSDTYLDDGTPPVDDENYVGNGQGWCVFNGSIAVDPRTERAFTAVSTADVECANFWYTTPTTKEIYAFPFGGSPVPVMDVTGKDDVRILFPAGQILVMSEADERDTLTFLDQQTYQVNAQQEQGVRYHGTRMSHSRRFVAVADNTSEYPDIHVIDTATHDIAVIPNNGDWLEAMWANTQDRLLAIVFYDSWNSSVGHARIMSWSPDEATHGFFREVDERGLWADADLDIEIDGVEGDLFFSFTWVGISPDDRYAVFPVVEDPGDEAAAHPHVLIVVDLQTGTHRVVRDAYGPVGFTPDSSTIVSYRYLEVPGAEEGVTETLPALVLVDVESLVETTVPIENMNWGPEFYVTRQDNVVVIASPLGDTKILLHDIDSGATTELQSPEGANLAEFVSRDDQSELWMVTDGLHRLDYAEAAYESVDLSFSPEHINILPRRDLLVLDDPSALRLVYFDPDLRVESWAVSLPTP